MKYVLTSVHRKLERRYFVVPKAIIKFLTHTALKNGIGLRNKLALEVLAEISICPFRKLNGKYLVMRKNFKLGGGRGRGGGST